MIEKLEMFITLARARHFGHAAEACGVSQPALSASIKQLEEQLGVLLVLRGSRFQGLTPEGQRVLEWARRLVGDARTMQQELKTIRNGLSGHLKIATIPTALSYVPALTAPFVASNPGVTVTVLSRSSAEILSLLENLDIDVGITYLENEPLGKVTQIPLYRETYCLVTRADTDQAAGKRITWQDVSRLPLCLLTRDMQNRRILDGILAEVSADVAPTLEADSIITLFAHVQTGLWSTIMPESLAMTFAIDPLKTIPIIDPVAGARVGLVATHREPHAPLISALLRQARHLAQAEKPEPTSHL